LYRAYQQNPEAVQRWKQEEFPEIREQARKAGAEVYFGDESGVNGLALSCDTPVEMR
jgi:hypothetical protein